MAQFKGLNCVSFESGHEYLRVDTSVWCDRRGSPEYRRLLAVDVPLIILYQAIPIMYAGLLITKRHQLNPGFKNRVASRAKRDRTPELARLKFLFEAYEVDRWGSDVFDMWRRITVSSGGGGIVCVPPLTSHLQTQMVGLVPFAPVEYRPLFGTALAALSLALFQEAQPYHGELGGRRSLMSSPDSH